MLNTSLAGHGGLLQGVEASLSPRAARAAVNVVHTTAGNRDVALAAVDLCVHMHRALAAGELQARVAKRDVLEEKLIHEE